MTAAQGTPNRGKGGKSVNLIKFDQFLDFSPKWSWGPLDRLKILSWGPLRFSTIENSILSTFTFSSFLDPDRPLAHFSLGPPWPRPSWGPGHCPAWTQESWTPLTPNAKVPLFLQFYCVFLRVGVTKYCILQGKMLAGSVAASRN